MENLKNQFKDYFERSLNHMYFGNVSLDFYSIDNYRFTYNLHNNIVDSHICDDIYTEYDNLDLKQTIIIEIEQLQNTIIVLTQDEITNTYDPITIETHIQHIHDITNVIITLNNFINIYLK